MAKRYFDEIEVGETHESPGVTITDWHVMGFAGLSMDFFELHTNDEFARQTQFGRRVAHGLLGLAVTDGLKNRSTFQVEGVASLHWSWDFVAPIFVGDTVTAKLRVAEKRPSKSRPEQGIVKIDLELVNQRGDVVQKGQNVTLVKRQVDGTENKDRGPEEIALSSVSRIVPVRKGSDRALTNRLPADDPLP